MFGSLVSFWGAARRFSSITVLPAADVQSFDGNGASVSTYAEEVRLWFRSANNEVAKRTSALILRMDLNARDARMALGSGRIMVPGAVANVLQMFRYYLAPDAPDFAYQDAAHFLRFRRTAQLRGDYLVKFDLLRRKAEARM